MSALSQIRRQAGQSTNGGYVIKIANCRLVLKAWFERHRYDYVFYRRLEKRAMMPWLDFKPADHVCELGCFNGANARKVSDEYGCTIYGLDISERVVKLAQSFNKTESVDFCVASAESLPFANETFNKDLFHQRA